MEFNRKTIITFPDDTDIPDITTGIVSGSLSLDEVLCEKNLNFGEFNASSFSAQLYYDNNIKGKKIQVYQLVNNEKIAIFTGIIDSCVRDDHDYFRDLIAYDEAYAYRNTNVAKWWASFWGTHTSASLKLLRNDLLKYMGITYIAKDLPNDDLQLTQSVSYDTLPFGDVLQYICQLSCCFPHMNRIGTLEFLTLDADTKNSVEVKTDSYENNNTSFETYSTAKITQVQLAGGSNSISAVTGEVGNTYTISDNPLLSGLDEEVLTQALTNILVACKDITFTPCEIKMLYNHLDLHIGQMINIKDVYTYLMSNSMSGTQLVEQEIKADGDEYYNETSGFSSNIGQIEDIQTMYKNNFYAYTYTNVKPIEVKDKPQSIIKFNLSATAKTDVIFMAMIPITLDLDGYVTATYYINKVLVPEDTVRAYYNKGDNILTLINYMSMDENGRLTFYVSLNTEYVESVERQHTAKILSFENYIKTSKYTEQAVDTTIPKINIADFKIKAVCFAKGLAGEQKWDGTIDIAETFAGITLGGLSLTNMKDVSDVKTQIPKGIGFTETFAGIMLGSLSIGTMNENIEFSKVIQYYSIDVSKKTLYTYNKDYVLTDTKYELKPGAPTPQTVITNGIDVSDKNITGIEKITAEYTGKPLIACSFDNKKTWKMYNGTEWVLLSETDTGMTMETLLAITSESWKTILTGLDSFILRFTLSSIEDTVTNIIIDFTN